MGGLCFQVLGSLGVSGVLGVLGVFVFKTPNCYQSEANQDPCEASDFHCKLSLPVKNNVLNTYESPTL